MLRHRDILQGIPFTWVTDHKGLIHILDQKGLSGRQARWMEKLSEFNFKVKYMAGEENILPDALSRLYEYDEPGTIRTPEEYLQYDANVEMSTTSKGLVLSAPLFVGAEALAISPRQSSRLQQGAKEVTPTPVPPTSSRPTPPATKTKQRTGQEGPPVASTSTGTQPRATRKGPLPPTETGRPETSADFAARMHDHFVLLGPGKQRKGGMGTGTQHNNERNQQRGSVSHNTDTSTNEQCSTIRILVTYPHEEKLLSQIKGQYHKDPFYKKILDSLHSFKNFETPDSGYIHLKLADRKVLCIPNIQEGERHLQETIIDQAHSLLAHLGHKKTLTYLREYVWWESMGPDVQAFCNSCITCQKSKPMTQKPYGLLNPLSVPSEPWGAIGVDFVGLFPESKDRNGEYDLITVIIDLLTAMVHLVPSQTNYTAKDIAELMFHEVYRLHGLPRAIISDQDILFTSLFWTHLNRLIGIRQKMSSAYHPETDGSTKRANRTIGQMLRACIGPNQKDWVMRCHAPNIFGTVDMEKVSQ